MCSTPTRHGSTTVKENSHVPQRSVRRPGKRRAPPPSWNIRVASRHGTGGAFIRGRPGPGSPGWLGSRPKCESCDRSRAQRSPRWSRWSRRESQPRPVAILQRCSGPFCALRGCRQRPGTDLQRGPVRGLSFAARNRRHQSEYNRIPEGGPNPQVALATANGGKNNVPFFVKPDGPVREARFKFLTNAEGTVDPTQPDGNVHDLYTIQGRNAASIVRVVEARGVPTCNLGIG